jgi:BirA family biotin operon repressor/biotin-[acetyl-CoA-carboxylase] ligase
MNTYDTSLFKILDNVDSTNNYAMAKVHAGMATHGMAWFAREQTAGKGQRGKHWVSNREQNILLSIAAVPFGLLPSQQFCLSASVALGCYDFFSKYAGAATAIKWPNDLYWNDRKAGGVLIENIFTGNKWNWAIIGLGININQIQFGDGIINPVSLQPITGTNYDVIEMAKELYQFVIKRLENLQESNFKNIIEEYNLHLFKKDCSVVLKKDNIRFRSIIKNVNEHGQLITEDNMERIFNWGEVEWVLETF